MTIRPEDLDAANIVSRRFGYAEARGWTAAQFEATWLSSLALIFPGAGVRIGDYVLWEKRAGEGGVPELAGMLLMRGDTVVARRGILKAEAAA